MWAKTETISGSGKRAPNSGVPLRSQNLALHVEQYNMRREWHFHSIPFYRSRFRMATSSSVSQPRNQLLW
jgi:hypothetical protein